jgi:two-component system, chemotaxis family, chemotaxis protein CheY
MRRQERRSPIVMVVDDNASIRGMVSWALELDGYEPVEAADGREALAWMDNAAREGRYPSVIVLDLAMPGMNGQAFLQHLPARWEAARPLPAIVVITAASQAYDVAALGAQNVMLKPFHVRDLLDIVHRFTP